MCQKNEATIHLTQVVNGAAKKMHLCESCAEANGVDVQNPTSIAELLLGLGKPKPPPDGGEAPEEAACPHCHMRPGDFKKSGRLGCPHCYETFAAELAPLLRSMHRGEQHTGKIPQGQSARLRVSAEASQLQRELEEAVAGENFEKAAQLRDRLADCRRRLAAAGSGERP
jgi:protein arginine kinase activator